MSDDRFEVEHRPEESRYVLVDHDTSDAVIGEESYLDVNGEPVRRVLFHTAVSDDYAGQGLASRLVRAVVDDVVDNGLSIVPVCPYVAAWLPKHPEYAEHVVTPTPAHLEAVREHQKGH